MNSSKTLTFGQLPALHELVNAINETAGADGLYAMELNTRDLQAARALRLGLADSATSTFSGDNGKQGFLFEPLEMAQIIRDLTDAGQTGRNCRNEDLTDDQIEWADSFASSIMTTLGYEWV